MTDLGVMRFIPGDASQVILGLEILEPDVPDKRAECLNGIHLVALRADKAQSEALVRVLRKTRFTISGIVVTGVLEGLEARVTQRNGAANKWLGDAAQW